MNVLGAYLVSNFSFGPLVFGSVRVTAVVLIVLVFSELLPNVPENFDISEFFIPPYWGMG